MFRLSNKKNIFRYALLVKACLAERFRQTELPMNNTAPFQFEIFRHLTDNGLDTDTKVLLAETLIPDTKLKMAWILTPETKCCHWPGQ